MNFLPVRILIVDDEEIIRFNLMAFFEDEGFFVKTAGTGEDALQTLDTERFDAGIVDIRLPNMDGDTLILKAHKLQPHMKFIIHTGSTTYTLPESLIDIGVEPQQVFIKPLSDMHVLAQTIRQLIQLIN